MKRNCSPEMIAESPSYLEELTAKRKRDIESACKKLIKDFAKGCRKSASQARKRKVPITRRSF